MLITLAIIGVVAALTIPSVVRNYQEQQFKTAYKKAFSEFSNVVNLAIASNEMPYRTNVWDVDATTQEWNVIKKYFKATKLCENNNAYQCWKDADTICTGICRGGGNANAKGVPDPSAFAFIDNAGRSWAQFSPSEQYMLVDTNGFKEPNKFGRDRWSIRIKYSNNTTGRPIGTAVSHDDYTTKSYYCTYPPCYYKSWLK